MRRFTVLRTCARMPSSRSFDEVKKVVDERSEHELAQFVEEGSNSVEIACAFAV